MQEFIHDKKLYYSPIEFALSHLGGTWNIPILLHLKDGPLRYRELKAGIPHVTDKMLHTQLRTLENKQMLLRNAFREKPPRVEYTLTQRAVAALDVIEALSKYGELLMDLEAEHINSKFLSFK